MNMWCKQGFCDTILFNIDWKITSFMLMLYVFKSELYQSINQSIKM